VPRTITDAQHDGRTGLGSRPPPGQRAALRPHPGPGRVGPPTAVRYRPPAAEEEHRREDVSCPPALRVRGGAAPQFEVAPVVRRS